MTATEQVILVDEQDRPLGTAEKLTAHQQGLCHRAFSVFIFRQQPELKVLIQQRASHKYHTPNLWTNTCCSHPRPGEDTLQAGQRRLKEEMGIETVLKWAGSFHYIAPFKNGLTENEYDHVLIGTVTDEIIQFDPEEVQAYRWVNLQELQTELTQHPEKFTPWLQKALDIAARSLV